MDIGSRSPHTGRIAAALLASGCLLGSLIWLTSTHRIVTGQSVADSQAISATKTPAAPADPAVSRPTRPRDSPALPSRPPPQALYKNLERAGFKWIFTRLRATDAELNWIAAGQFSKLIAELRPAVERNDARATAIFGWVAERCRSVRTAEQMSGWRDTNSVRLRQLPAADLADYREVTARQDEWESSFRSACQNQIDQDYADQQLEKTAAREDGASLWLLSRRSGNLSESFRLMSQAASTGFAQAQYEFARSLIDADARKSIPDAPPAVSLLTEAASEVPEAKGMLALCLFSGCGGTQPDYAAAVSVAREAASEGQPDGLLILGSQAPAGALSADEVAAWRLFKRTLAAQGCYGDEDAAFGLQPRGASDPIPPPSEVARSLATTFWQRYGASARVRLGCGD